MEAGRRLTGTGCAPPVVFLLVEASQHLFEKLLRFVLGHPVAAAWEELGPERTTLP